MIELIAVFRIELNISSLIACSELWMISTVIRSDAAISIRGSTRKPPDPGKSRPVIAWRTPNGFLLTPPGWVSMLLSSGKGLGLFVAHDAVRLAGLHRASDGPGRDT